MLPSIRTRAAPCRRPQGIRTRTQITCWPRSSSRRRSDLPYAEALSRWRVLEAQRLRETYYADGPYPRRVLNRRAVRRSSGIRAAPGYQPPPCPPSVRAPMLGQDMRTAATCPGAAPRAPWSRRWAISPGGIAPCSAGAFWSRGRLAEMTSLVSLKTGQPIADVNADDPGGFGLRLGPKATARPWMAPCGRMWAKRMVLAR